MANYNTFVVVNCNTRKPILTTSSARKANEELTVGVRVEVWNSNARIEVIHECDKRREKYPLAPYIQQEREYIRKSKKKQNNATKDESHIKQRRSEMNEE